MIWLKRIGLALGVLLIIALIGLVIFMYKAKNGFGRYETDIPNITIPVDKPKVLLFSKTTAFRHGAAIKACKQLMDSLASQEGWYLHETEQAGIFNQEQLSQFDLVIWNNSTGPVLTKEQRSIFEQYIDQGGGYLGIHGAGDFSHKWDWYRDKLICADFSHHPIKNHIQRSTVYLSETADSIWNIPPVWAHDEEWYIFHNNPESKGARLVYQIDGTSIDPNGDFLWMKGMDFGMGDIHPVAWTHDVGQGRAFYTSMGHTAEAFENKNFIQMIKAAIIWSGQLE